MMYLPAEIIRKGRFDQVFFCDLPTDQERQDIFRIHLLRNGANPDDFDFKMLAVMTQGRLLRRAGTSPSLRIVIV